ncbi:TAXI family TRAP transporter solute-binding subunit [Methylocystis bryophila]|uniref:C4-dicarboxylate ABC transporter substrate-binding protein n=1 Tax=Methylocystis bryophila TaxID=655015 RepID=A0A1W6MQH7_9HYPH|nr:TAXI family TRAP transporter solute-binding subunit [Methylocystis bryophila]ARN79796.1 C4-dicarboxylate ABC transporter substrate-binding protein [Methylocystis bryophila]BDV39679.1 TRAP ABC transporter [Methylocystis bryophila]
MFGIRLPRMATIFLAGAFLLIAGLLAAMYLWLPKATLTITTGPNGGVAQRFISAFIATTEAAHPRIHFETVSVPDLGASAKALEERKVNIALARSDLPPPVNGQTLVILRRDVIAIVLPPGSPIENVGQLAGKTVAIPTSPVQKENSHALDLILSYFNVSPEAVKRVFLDPSQIGAALRSKRAAAVLAVGPIGPGQVVDTVAAVAKATRGTPSILDLDEAEAIAKRNPGFEEIDIPKGAFKGNPSIPDDDAKGVAVTYRFVVPTTMLNAVAGALARSILKTKAKLVELAPAANQIEAPDPDEKNPILPIHPGVAAYLASGDQSFFDSFQTYFYFIGILLSVVGSAIALTAGLFSNRKLRSDQENIFRLLTIGNEALTASSSELDALQQEFRTILESCVGNLAEGSTEAGQAAVSLAVDHARHSISQRRAALGRTSEPRDLDTGPAG